MNNYSLQFSQNGKSAKILVTVQSENLAQAIMDATKMFNITTVHKCYEVKEDTAKKES